MKSQRFLDYINQRALNALAKYPIQPGYSELSPIPSEHDCRWTTGIFVVHYHLSTVMLKNAGPQPTWFISGTPQEYDPLDQYPLSINGIRVRPLDDWPREIPNTNLYCGESQCTKIGGDGFGPADWPQFIGFYPKPYAEEAVLNAYYDILTQHEGLPMKYLGTHNDKNLVFLPAFNGKSKKHYLLRLQLARAPFLLGLKEFVPAFVHAYTKLNMDLASSIYSATFFCKNSLGILPTPQYRYFPFVASFTDAPHFFSKDENGPSIVDWVIAESNISSFYTEKQEAYVFFKRGHDGGVSSVKSGIITPTASDSLIPLIKINVMDYSSLTAFRTVVGQFLTKYFPSSKDYLLLAETHPTQSRNLTRGITYRRLNNFLCR